MSADQAAKLRQLAQSVIQKADLIEAAEKDGNATQKAPLLSDVVGLIDDLRLEALGPYQYLFYQFGSSHDVGALAVLEEFKLVSHVPADGTISYADLAKASGCPQDQLTRLVRLLILNRIFTEPKPGQVGHSLLSKMLKDNEIFAAVVGHSVHDGLPAAAFLKDALRKYGDGQEPNQSGFSLSHGTEEPFFDYLVRHPAMSDRFNTAMRITAASRRGFSRSKLYPWEKIGTLVDIGGGEGHIAAELAQANPKLKVIVEDLETAVTTGLQKIPEDVKDRISFKVHDMFTPQPVEKADAYLVSHILHDWPDKWALKILKSIIPAMQPGSKILVADSIMPEPGQVSMIDEKFVRYKDIHMMELFNSKERTLEDFITLFKETDPRLQFKKAWSDPANPLSGSIIEAEFTG